MASSPEARKDPKVMAALTKHLQQHIDMYKGMDPLLAELLKMKPQQQAPPPNIGQPNAQGMDPMAQALDAANPVTQEAAQVNMPNMPMNPMNGKKGPQSGNL